MSEIDKQLESEARELHRIWRLSRVLTKQTLGLIRDWEHIRPEHKAIWREVARKHRELAAKERRPLVEAARALRDTTDYDKAAEIIAVCRELDKLEGGGG